MSTHSRMNDALSQAVAEAQIDAKDSMHESIIVVCVGKPWCHLSGDDATEEMEKGCILCDRFIVDPDGSWVVEKSPGVTYREN